MNRERGKGVGQLERRQGKGVKGCVQEPFLLSVSATQATNCPTSILSNLSVCPCPVLPKTQAEGGMCMLLQVPPKGVQRCEIEERHN